ncbi:PilN domain-containing protein [Dyella sp. A6]|uniref:PilN domain-containing protein n=1 Tax=Dyella aluminiiresistens TaxID=3069105 RepID=UPI002E7812D9|nr:PilN domain-containing protein [Dyella sp. A6]
MARINLLPWRIERRKQREREFFMQLGAAFVAAILFVLLWSFWMGMRIDNQNDRNAYLQGQIKQVDVKIAKINSLEKVRSELLARKKIIEQLQENRSQMVHLFDELVKTIPSSARLTALKQNGQSMTLDGVAESNASVAEYMRNIEKSPWMGQASLSKTENTHEATRMPYTFGLTVALSRPKDADSSKAELPVGTNGPATKAAATKAMKPMKPAQLPASSASTATKGKSVEKPTVSVSAMQPAAHPPAAHDAAVKGGAKS